MAKPEIYVSTDIEADGPIPGPYSMLSFASAAFTADKHLISTFSANLETLPNATTHADTKAWWDKNPEAWNECRKNCVQPEEAMIDYVNWLKQLPGKPVFVGYPATYDFMFMYWYLINFTGESPFSHAGLDIKSYAMAVLNTDFSETSKPKMPKNWFDDLPHTHISLDDAIEQGHLFCNILSANKK